MHHFVLATEFGIFFTVEGGGKWIQLKGGLPTISFRDLAIQRRENDLVGASFGRGFFVLDDYTALRHVNAEAMEQEAILFPARKAPWYFERRPLGDDGQAFLDGRLASAIGAVGAGPVRAAPFLLPVAGESSTVLRTVVYAEWSDAGYGNLVIVENGDWRMYYAHLSSFGVGVGQPVQMGTVVGASGNTGWSTGPHLHYEVRMGDRAVNPLSYILDSYAGLR